MKKIILSILFLVIIFSGFITKAGDLKNILIDTDDAIVQEFYNKGDDQIDDITNHQFVLYADGIAVQAVVTSVNNRWVCTVYFKKLNDIFSPINVVCK